MAVTAPAAGLALPSGERARPRNVLNLAALLGGGASLMLFAALCAAYIGVRHAAGGWPPKGVKIDNYLGSILVITALLSSALVEWGASAARRGVRKQAMGGLAIAMLVGLALLNALWYLLNQFHFGIAKHGYAALAYAMVALTAIHVVAGIVALAGAWMKAAGRQVLSPYDEAVRAAATYWQFIVAGWVVVYAALFLLK